MRSHLSAIVAAGTATVAAALLSSSPAMAGHGPSIGSSSGSPQSAASPQSTSSACYVQGSANGVGWSSQKFEPAHTKFDNRGADDFRLKRTCTVDLVTVKGSYFNGSGPADWISVIVYHDKGGKPGTIVRQFNHRSYTDSSGQGNFAIALPAFDLNPGLYWISVQARMSYTEGGQWGWDTSYNLHNNQPVWRNPDDGFGSGCTTYQSLFDCGFDDEDGGESFAFTIG